MFCAKSPINVYRRSSCALESDPSYLERPTCLSKPRVARKSSACWHRRRILRKPPAHYHIIQTPINTASIRCAHLGINSIAFENRASSVMIASAMASDKYPLSLPALKSSNGRMAEWQNGDTGLARHEVGATSVLPDKEPPQNHRSEDGCDGTQPQH
jgi:hypothetical protein